MGNLVNPVSMRLGNTLYWSSQWVSYQNHLYSFLLSSDYLLYSYLDWFMFSNYFNKLGWIIYISHYKIVRLSNQVLVLFFFKDYRFYKFVYDYLFFLSKPKFNFNKRNTYNKINTTFSTNKFINNNIKVSNYSLSKSKILQDLDYFNLFYFNKNKLNSINVTLETNNNNIFKSIICYYNLLDYSSRSYYSNIFYYNSFYNVRDYILPLFYNRKDLYLYLKKTDIYLKKEDRFFKRNIPLIFNFYYTLHKYPDLVSNNLNLINFNFTKNIFYINEYFCYNLFSDFVSNILIFKPFDFIKKFNSDLLLVSNNFFSYKKLLSSSKFQDYNLIFSYFFFLQSYFNFFKYDSYSSFNYFELDTNFVFSNSVLLNNFKKCYKIKNNYYFLSDISFISLNYTFFFFNLFLFLCFYFYIFSIYYKYLNKNVNIKHLSFNKFINSIFFFNQIFYCFNLNIFLDFFSDFFNNFNFKNYFNSDSVFNVIFFKIYFSLIFSLHIFYDFSTYFISGNVINSLFLFSNFLFYFFLYTKKYLVTSFYNTNFFKFRIYSKKTSINAQINVYFFRKYFIKFSKKVSFLRLRINKIWLKKYKNYYNYFILFNLNCFKFYYANNYNFYKFYFSKISKNFISKKFFDMSKLLALKYKINLVKKSNSNQYTLLNKSISSNLNIATFFHTNIFHLYRYRILVLNAPVFFLKKNKFFLKPTTFKKKKYLKFLIYGSANIKKALKYCLRSYRTSFRFFEFSDVPLKIFIFKILRHIKLYINSWYVFNKFNFILNKKLYFFIYLSFKNMFLFYLSNIFQKTFIFLLNSLLIYKNSPLNNHLVSLDPFNYYLLNNLKLFLSFFVFFNIEISLINYVTHIIDFLNNFSLKIFNTNNKIYYFLFDFYYFLMNWLSFSQFFNIINIELYKPRIFFIRSILILATFCLPNFLLLKKKNKKKKSLKFKLSFLLNNKINQFSYLDVIKKYSYINITFVCFAEDNNKDIKSPFIKRSKHFNDAFNTIHKKNDTSNLVVNLDKTAKNAHNNKNNNQNIRTYNNKYDNKNNNQNIKIYNNKYEHKNKDQNIKTYGNNLNNTERLSSYNRSDFYNNKNNNYNRRYENPWNKKNSKFLSKNLKKLPNKIVINKNNLDIKKIQKLKLFVPITKKNVLSIKYNLITFSFFNWSTYFLNKKFFKYKIKIKLYNWFINFIILGSKYKKYIFYIKNFKKYILLDFINNKTKANLFNYVDIIYNLYFNYYIHYIYNIFFSTSNSILFSFNEKYFCCFLEIIYIKNFNEIFVYYNNGFFFFYQNFLYFYFNFKKKKYFFFKSFYKKIFNLTPLILRKKVSKNNFKFLDFFFFFNFSFYDGFHFNTFCLCCLYNFTTYLFDRRVSIIKRYFNNDFLKKFFFKLLCLFNKFFKKNYLYLKQCLRLFISFFILKKPKKKKKKKNNIKIFGKNKLFFNNTHNLFFFFSSLYFFNNVFNCLFKYSSFVFFVRSTKIIFTNKNISNILRLQLKLLFSMSFLKNYSVKIHMLFNYFMLLHYYKYNLCIFNYNKPLVFFKKGLIKNYINSFKLLKSIKSMNFNVSRKFYKRNSRLSHLLFLKNNKLYKYKKN